jgi:hypothetical protein
VVEGQRTMVATYVAVTVRAATVATVALGTTALVCARVPLKPIAQVRAVVP